VFSEQLCVVLYALSLFCEHLGVVRLVVCLHLRAPCVDERVGDVYSCCRRPSAVSLMRMQGTERNAASCQLVAELKRAAPLSPLSPVRSAKAGVTACRLIT
jgi:hypothetical protein